MSKTQIKERSSTVRTKSETQPAPTGLYSTQREAVEAARDFARKNRAEDPVSLDALYEQAVADIKAGRVEQGGWGDE